jgi:hypothetical protein
LKITKRLKVGKHNTLSGETAPGRTGSSIDGEYSTPLSVWPCGPQHKGAQTAIGGTCLRCGLGLGAKVSGSQNDLLTPWYDGRAEIIPLRSYLPVLLGGKGTSHVGWDTGDLPSQGKKLRASNPTQPMCSPRRDA